LWRILSGAHMGRVRRGRILRDTSAGNGLVFVDGKQYLFRLEAMWKSEFAPKIDMLVDVEFDDRGQLIALRTASVEAVAAEQTTQAFNAAKAGTRRLAHDVRSDTVPAIVQYAQALGYPTLVALAALLLGWFYFSVASIDLGGGGRLATTFYQVLKLLNVRGIQDLIGGGSAGIYGILCFLCVGGVLLPLFWRDRRASYAMLAPLIFMVLIGLLVRHKIAVQMNDLQQATSHFNSQVGALGDPRTRQFASQFTDQMVKKVGGSFSLDFGAWLSLAAGLYLAWRGIRKVQLDDDDDELETVVERPTVNSDRAAPGPAAPLRATAGRDYFDKGPERPASPSA
jgi:hypothetical protein